MNKKEMNKENVVKAANTVKVKIKEVGDMKKKVIIGLVCLLFVVGFVCVKRNNTIDIVKEGRFAVAPNVTVEELFTTDFTNIKWSVEKEDGRKYVVCNCIMEDELDPDSPGYEIEAKFLIKGEKFRLVKVYVDGIDSGDVDGFVYAIIDDFNMKNPNGTF